MTTTLSLFLRKKAFSSRTKPWTERLLQSPSLPWLLNISGAQLLLFLLTCLKLLICQTIIRFLCTLKLGRPLLIRCLSYWIAKAISTFNSSNKGSAHDCRKFGHSLAFTRGILPKVILSHGFWLTINAFIHKYLIPVEEPVIPCIAGRSGI